MILLLLGLILLPIGTFIIARRKKPKYLYFYTGLSFGLVAIPFCMGIYGLYYFHFISRIKIGFYVAMAGYVLMTVHGYPGGVIMKVLSAENWTDSFALNHILYWSINSFIWMSFYGLIGKYIDKIRKGKLKQTI